MCVCGGGGGGGGLKICHMFADLLFFFMDGGDGWVGGGQKIGNLLWTS